jgi:hypothetical protein
MSDANWNKAILDAILMSLEETFENVRGLYLDKGTSLFETLATVTAEEASTPMGENCATIAAHVEHTAFYLEVVPKYVADNNFDADWGDIWTRVSAVTPEEWEASQKRLKDAYELIKDFAKNTPDWLAPDAIAGAMGMLMHNAYHLGEIRQALCKIRR